MIEYVSLGDVCRQRLGMQCQYGARYAHGAHGWPDLGSDLRITGSVINYHGMTIHRDDVETFVSRVLAQRESER